jgi:hypothetical protein
MKSHWDDMLLVLGGALIVTGLALIHAPSAVIFAGVAVSAIAALGAWSEARTPPTKAVEKADDDRGL